mmetsp:Transcript_8264/g.16299  ORF Transcript_8264/g.16299 Transcript_8264/m.16299 type:complete len:122 (-) Transcript_8264:238-603(-)
MLDERAGHGSVYDNNYLYAIGGCNFAGNMIECERMSMSEDRWEPLKPLPQKCNSGSVVVLKEIQCLYILGGYNRDPLDLIQRLNLVVLEWDIMPIRLPSAVSFKLLASTPLKSSTVIHNAL